MIRLTALSVIFWGFGFILTAQDAPTTEQQLSYGGSANHAWEVGLHGGHFFSAGNVDFIPGYGGGLHIRRALDYVFSLRLDLMYANGNGEDPGNTRNYSNTWLAGSLQAVASLNNLKWDLGERKTNIYTFAGIGLNSFSVDLVDGGKEFAIEDDVAFHTELGAGIGFRINQRVNIGLEHKAGIVFGDRSDLLDGVNTLVANPDERSTFNDLYNYTSVRLNINIGDLEKNTEPLYWLNPLDAVMADVQKLKDSRVTLNDEDGDGVIDMLDSEEDTPANAAVDSKGVVLDSDGDGHADYQDKEPFSPPGYEVDGEGVAQVPDVMEEVNRLLEEKLKNFTPASTAAPKASISNWYLPSIHFNLDSYKLSDTELATLAEISQVLKSNPDLKLVTTGHTDETGSEHYNNNLSYQRAKAVIDQLVEFGTARERLILVWKGEAQNLAEGRHGVNRRVDFKVANGETEMAAPVEAGNDE